MPKVDLSRSGPPEKIWRNGRARRDDGWFVGKLKEIPGVFGQGETPEELKENIIGAYRMILAE